MQTLKTSDCNTNHQIQRLVVIILVGRRLKLVIVRSSGWIRKPWHCLKGGGGGDGEDLHRSGEKRKKDCSEDLVTKSSISKRKAKGSSSDESLPKRRKILMDYKQRTPRKSPLKTPTKRKTPRLRCENVLCRVGFSTKRAKLQHERFSCPFIKSPLEALSSSSTTSAGGNENQCRFCDKVFSEVRNRKRHERDQHQSSVSSGASVASQVPRCATPESRANASSLISYQPGLSSEVDINWNTPRGADKMKDSSSICKFCHQGIKSSYRLSFHEISCTFQVPQILLQDSNVCIPRVRILENCEKLKDVIGYACVEDLYEYNNLARLAIPGIYPLVFLGTSHFGGKCPPILLKTANNRSQEILMKLLHLHKSLTLHNHIILVDEKSGTESYLGPNLLIPDSINLTVKFSDFNVTTLELINKGNDVSDESESDDEEIEITVDNTEDTPNHGSFAPFEDEFILSSDEIPSGVMTCLEEMFSFSDIMQYDCPENMYSCTDEVDNSHIGLSDVLPEPEVLGEVEDVSLDVETSHLVGCDVNETANVEANSGVMILGGVGPPDDIGHQKFVLV